MTREIFMAILQKKISVVAPCYKESANIRALYGRVKAVLEANTADWEIIFVDTASPDNSEEIFRVLAAEDRRVKVIFFSRNFGHSQYGYAAGTDYASGDAVVWIDGDLQDPPELISEFIKKWGEGYDVVYGVRERRKGNALLRGAYKLFYRLFKKMSYLDIPLDAGDFSLIDRKVVDVINAMPERDRYMRGLRTWAGFRSIGISYTRLERGGGVTSNNWRRNIWWAKKAIFSFSYAPLEFIFYLSLGVFLLTVIAIVAYIIAYFINPGPRGFTTILLAVLFLGSCQLLALSVIAEYTGKIFEETKRRPKYIVREILNDRR